MRYGLDRANYNGLVLFPSNADEHDCERILADEYPKPTGAAVTELRSRGYDARVPQLDYLVRRGTIPHPGGEGRNRLWSAESIDAAADYFEREQIYTPGTMARYFKNIDPAQDIEAMQEAERASPDVSDFVMTIIPGRPGASEYSRVEYRPMTPADIVPDGKPARTITLADMLANLRSDNPDQRMAAGVLLAHSMGEGARQSGMTEEEAELGAGRDLRDTLLRAVDGDSEAVDTLERVLTSDPSKASATPTEPSPHTERRQA